MRNNKDLRIENINEKATTQRISIQNKRIESKQIVQLHSFNNNYNMKSNQYPIQLMRGVLQLQEKPKVSGNSKDSVKLSNLVNSLFKEAPAGGAKIGDGSALAACNHEYKGGDLVGGADHQEKCRQVLNGIENLIKRTENPNVIKGDNQLTPEDLVIAKSLQADLKKALKGDYEG